jgi:hypothetical protein
LELKFEAKEDQAMELLDRYLEAVKKNLPWERQDDIIAELRGNLEAQLEDKQEELGHTLTPDEAKAWVGQLPRPAMMASRYRRQQYLIGPGLFPIYSLILRMVTFWLAIVMVIVNILKAFVHPGSADTIAAAIAAGIGNVGLVLIANAAVITLVFAATEYALAHHPEKFTRIAEQVRSWDLNELPPLEPVKGKRPRTLVHAVAELVGHVVLLCWLLLLPKNPFLLLGPGAFAVYALPYTFAPVIVNFYWAVVVLNVVQVVWKAIDMQTGAWRGERRVRHVVDRLLGLIPLVILLMAPEHLWVVLKNPAADFTKYGSQLGQINDAIYLGLRVVLAITVITLAIELCKWGFRSYKQRVVTAR